MKYRFWTLCCFASVLGAVCGSAQAEETILLVSLDDGQVVMQTITTEADICFKMAASSATTCLVRGAPVVDPETNEVIGIEMIETHIDLVAKTD